MGGGGGYISEDAPNNPSTRRSAGDALPWEVDAPALRGLRVVRCAKKHAEPHLSEPSSRSYTSLDAIRRLLGR